MNNKPTVETQMLIRKPVATVFQAFIDPAITTNFWFTKSSGKLEVGKTVTWEWEMYGVSINVLTKQIIPGKLISTEWNNPATTVDYEFTSFTEDSTYVVIKNYGFNLTGDDLIQAIKDNTGGFTTVLDGLKAYLEYGLRLNLIADKFPDKVNSKIKTDLQVATNKRFSPQETDTEKDPDDAVHHLQEPDQFFNVDGEIDIDDLVHRQNISHNENEEEDMDDLVHRKYKKE